MNALGGSRRMLRGLQTNNWAGNAYASLIATRSHQVYTRTQNPEQHHHHHHEHNHDHGHDHGHSHSHGLEAPDAFTDLSLRVSMMHPRGAPESNVIPVPALPTNEDITDMGDGVVEMTRDCLRKLPIVLHAKAQTNERTEQKDGQDKNNQKDQKGKKNLQKSPKRQEEKSKATTKLVQVYFGPRHAVHPWQQPRLELMTVSRQCWPSSVLGEVTRERFVKKHATEPLWWMVLVHNSPDLPTSAFVRTTLRRQVGRAFRQALRQRGYDPQGRPLTGEEREKAVSWALSSASPSASTSASTSISAAPAPTPAAAPLYGTVKMEGVVKVLARARKDQLLNYLDAVVVALEKELPRQYHEEQPQRQRKRVQPSRDSSSSSSSSIVPQFVLGKSPRNSLRPPRRSKRQS